MHSRSQAVAFSLIELLVVISIIGLIMAILLPMLGQAKESARRAKELSAARMMMTAYTAYAVDHGGWLLPGMDRTATVRDRDGNVLTYPVSERYPWRLSAYLEQHAVGAIYVNDAEYIFGSAAQQELGANWSYMVSLFGSLGINGYNVGGYYILQGGKLALSQPAAQRMGDVLRPSALMAFASASSDATLWTAAGGQWPGGDIIPAYHLIQQRPTILQPGAMPASNGNVDLRWDGRACTAMLDGHAMLSDPQFFELPEHWKNNP